MTEAVELRVGQVWVPRGGSRAKSRQVSWAGNGPRWMMQAGAVGWLEQGLTDPACFEADGIRWHTWSQDRSFRAWIRKHNAQLQPETSDV